jgi:hypothetical protein
MPKYRAENPIYDYLSLCNDFRFESPISSGDALPGRSKVTRIAVVHNVTRPSLGKQKRNDVMALSSATRRSAQISYDTKGDDRLVRVSAPAKLTPDEIARIDKVLINDVIHGLTGCTCLSGTIRVIWDRAYEKVIDVKL